MNSKKVKLKKIEQKISLFFRNITTILLLFFISTIGVIAWAIYTFFSGDNVFIFSLWTTFAITSLIAEVLSWYKKKSFIIFSLIASGSIIAVFSIAQNWIAVLFFATFYLAYEFFIFYKLIKNISKSETKNKKANIKNILFYFLVSLFAVTLMAVIDYYITLIFFNTKTVIDGFFVWWVLCWTLWANAILLRFKGYKNSIYVDLIANIVFVAFLAVNIVYLDYYSFNIMAWIVYDSFMAGIYLINIYEIKYKKDILASLRKK